MSNTETKIPIEQKLNRKFGELTTFVGVEQFTKELHANDGNITADMMKQSGLTAYYGVQWSRAKSQRDREKINVSTIHARIMKRVRTELAKSDEKATNAVMQAMVDDDPLMIGMNMRFIDAEEILDIARVAYDTFKYRREMLTGIGNMKRSERRGEQSQRELNDKVEGHRQRRRSLKDKIKGTPNEAE